MLGIPKHGELEQRLLLLMHIGRDVEKRGEGGFNVGLELTGDVPGDSLASKERYFAFEFLKRAGYIEAYDEEIISDMDYDTTFIKCKLTDKGSRLYTLIEDHYLTFLNEFDALKNKKTENNKKP